jgi:hypothetical protein
MSESLDLSAVIDEIVSSPAEIPAERGSKEDLCRNWPSIKQGLELLAKLYPKAKIIAAILIAIGDRVCPS